MFFVVYLFHIISFYTYIFISFFCCCWGVGEEEGGMAKGKVGLGGICRTLLNIYDGVFFRVFIDA